MTSAEFACNSRAKWVYWHGQNGCEPLFGMIFFIALLYFTKLMGVMKNETGHLCGYYSNHKSPWQFLACNWIVLSLEGHMLMELEIVVFLFSTIF